MWMNTRTSETLGGISLSSAARRRSEGGKWAVCGLGRPILRWGDQNRRPDALMPEVLPPTQRGT